MQTKLKANYRINAAPYVDQKAKEWCDGKMTHDLGCKLADYIINKDPGTQILVCNEGKTVKLEDHGITEVHTRTLGVTELDDPHTEEFVVVKNTQVLYAQYYEAGYGMQHNFPETKPPINGNYLCFYEYWSDDNPWRYKRYDTFVYLDGDWIRRDMDGKHIKVLAWFYLPKVQA